MLSSIVVFCSNPSPPQPRAFLVCTACAFAVGVLLNFVGEGASSRACSAVAGGLHMLLSKLSSHSFSPSVGLAAYVATTAWADPWSGPVGHLITPWLAGHCILYIFAMFVSVPRRAVRVRLAMREWRVQAATTVGDVSKARLEELFKQCDTSGDGCIDAIEFRVAYRSLTQQDLPLSDCEHIIRSFDADGSGRIEFTEFCEALAPWLAGSGSASAKPSAKTE
jgi:hypothetical protein